MDNWLRAKIRQPLLERWRRFAWVRRFGSIPLGLATSILELRQNAAKANGVASLKLWPQKSLPRRTPIILPEDRHPHLVETRPFARPALWLARLRNAEVHGPTIGVTTCSRLFLVEVSVEWSHPPENHGLMRRFFLSPSRHLRGQSLLLAATGGDNYFHWMLDVLPRIKLILEAGKRLNQFDHILINSGQKTFQQETLAKFGIQPDQLVAMGPRSRYRCDQLWVPSLPAVLGHPTPSNVRFLRSVFLEGKPGAARRRILVGRAEGRSRQTKGWKEVCNMLFPFGFEEIEPANLTVQEQAAVFSEAEWVVGIHGAALANLAFCRPGTRVVEILGRDYVNPCYRALSDAAGLRYHALIGGSWSRSPVFRLDQPGAPIDLAPNKARRFFRHIGLI